MKTGTSPIVLLPTTIWVPLGARLIPVPETVTAAPPGTSVSPPPTYCDALSAVKVSAPTVNAGAPAELRTIVLPAMTIALAEGARDTSVPCMLIGGAPGVSVWPPTTYWEAAFWVTCCEPTVIGNGPAETCPSGPSAGRTDVIPLITTAEADGAIEML